MLGFMSGILQVLECPGARQQFRILTRVCGCLARIDPGLQTLFGVASRTARRIQSDPVEIAFRLYRPLRLLERSALLLQLGGIVRFEGDDFPITWQIVDDEPAEPYQKDRKDCRDTPHHQCVEPLRQSISFFH
ncbi:hypothetical protein AA105894_0933 [Asaia spathodeae NBRC 105894]|nr:hypothetical protein AA105894_0933 [Asaia spathodeae NBRC 105894]